MRRFFIVSPLLVSLLVPVWFHLSDFLGYDLFIAPDPMPPRYDAPLLCFAFYLVWYPLALVFLLPGAILSSSFVQLFPEGELRFEVPALVAGLVYSLLVWLVCYFVRTAPRRQAPPA